ncbi:MAG: diguanylate cyclase [Comamonadaceae bacterium]|nr:MAG: diguanylate cyclase [Comamonadaceae bacterium]
MFPPFPATSDAAGTRQTVLVVDDLEPHRNLLEDLLFEYADVLTAGCGAEALEVARELRPDLILMDILMPDMDGLQVLQALQADPQTRGIPIVFLTALHAPDAEAHALAMGAVDYITKPVHSPVIMARVLAQLRMAAQRRAMLELVFVDELTGIANRRHFDEALRIECAKARRTGRLLSVGMVDVDCFKQFNDHYGHVAGDEALRAVAGALRQALRRPGDFVARFGGEEFALIVPDGGATADASAATAARRAQAACDAVCALGIPHADSTAAPVLTVSIGMVTGPCERGDGGLALLEQADQCLYAAKEGGRNRVVTRNA